MVSRFYLIWEVSKVAGHERTRPNAGFEYRQVLAEDTWVFRRTETLRRQTTKARQYAMARLQCSCRCKSPSAHLALSDCALDSIVDKLHELLLLLRQNVSLVYAWKVADVIPPLTLTDGGGDRRGLSTAFPSTRQCFVPFTPA